MKRWTEEDKDYLKKNFNKYTYKQLAQLLNRSVEAIKLQSKKLGLRKRVTNEWVEEDIKYLKENINKYSYEELGQLLNRTPNACRYKAFTMGIKKERPSSYRLRKRKKVLNWDDEKLYLLVSLHSSFSYRVIAEILECSEEECENKYKSLTKEEKENILKTRKSLYK